MAGKHVAVWANTVSAAPPGIGFGWNPKVTKAYAEGRGNTAPNGNLPGSPADLAYIVGDALSLQSSQQFETATFLAP